MKIREEGGKGGRMIKIKRKAKRNERKKEEEKIEKETNKR